MIKIKKCSERKCITCGIKKDKTEFNLNGSHRQCNSCYIEYKENNGFKKCTACKEKKSINKFAKDTRNKNNTLSICKKCKNAKDVERETRRNSKIKEIMNIHKICIKCGLNKHLSEFKEYKRKSKNENKCKDCISDEMREKNRYHFTFEEMRKRRGMII